jgi:hypothetical protein
MVVVPNDTVVTNPLTLIVATDGEELVHALIAAAVPEPVS